jgi:hypothetical protein
MSSLAVAANVRNPPGKPVAFQNAHEISRLKHSCFCISNLFRISTFVLRASFVLAQASARSAHWRVTHPRIKMRLVECNATVPLGRLCSTLLSLKNRLQDSNSTRTISRILAASLLRFRNSLRTKTKPRATGADDQRDRAARSAIETMFMSRSRGATRRVAAASHGSPLRELAEAA